MQKFNTFLESKPLYYKEIDHQRLHLAYGALKPHTLFYFMHILF